MNPIEYTRAVSLADAVAAGAAAQLLAGGTNLVDLWKQGVVQPPRLVDVSRLDLRAIRVMSDGSLELGALASNADTANHPEVATRLPLLRSAILAGASPQIRNRATNGGNLLQRTRCVYFYDPALPCNKRTPGSGCPAASGLTRQHAILGASPHCVATHPSDMCVALAALDASVNVQGSGGAREIAFADLHRLPGDRPEQDTTLAAGELITHLQVPAAPHPFTCYLKVRDRASYAFALVSVAVAVMLDDDGRIADARIALGGVAHKPWRDREAEQMLLGETPARDAFLAAARHLLRDARAWGRDGPTGNAFKIALAEQATVRALELALAGVRSNTGEEACR